MNNFISWQACDLWVVAMGADGKETQQHVTKQLICTHPQVEAVRFVGYIKANPEDDRTGIRLEMRLKNGQCRTFDVTADQYESGQVDMAELFLGVLEPNPISKEFIELKKRLYKEKPPAKFIHARKIGETTVLVYGCSLGDKERLPNIFFEVPVSELGDGLFGATLDAQLLIRYIVHPLTNQR